eukprot:757464-Hanusia_phi.AAC.5
MERGLKNYRQPTGRPYHGRRFEPAGATRHGTTAPVVGRSGTEEEPGGAWESEPAAQCGGEDSAGWRVMWTSGVKRRVS